MAATGGAASGARRGLAGGTLESRSGGFELAAGAWGGGLEVGERTSGVYARRGGPDRRLDGARLLGGRRQRGKLDAAVFFTCFGVERHGGPAGLYIGVIGGLNRLCLEIDFQFSDVIRWGIKVFDFHPKLARFRGKKGEESRGEVREESGRFPGFDLVGLVARTTRGSAEEREAGGGRRRVGPARQRERRRKSE